MRKRTHFLHVWLPDRKDPGSRGPGAKRAVLFRRIRDRDAGGSLFVYE